MHRYKEGVNSYKRKAESIQMLFSRDSHVSKKRQIMAEMRLWSLHPILDQNL